jgi:hypothetical protein
MRKIILIWSIAFLHSFASGQELKTPDSVKTKVYIIGVVHSENEFRNSDSLLKILKEIKPDLILDEGDSISSFFPRQYLLSKPPWWYIVGSKFKIIRSMPPEIEVLFDYKKLEENIKYLPFDKKISNRKEFIKLYLKSERKWYSLLNDAFTKGLIPDSLAYVHETYINYNSWLNSTIKKGYKEINNPIVIDSARQYQMIEEKFISNLVDSAGLFSYFNTWLPIYRAFWIDRNEAMANNIIKLIGMTKAKRVVVFTGLLHKYSLTYLLNMYNYYKEYELVEYFQK